METIGFTHPSLATPEQPQLILASSTYTAGELDSQFCQYEGAGDLEPSKQILPANVNFKATERALGSLPCARKPNLRLEIVRRNGSKRDDILGAQRHRPLEPEPALTPPAASGELKTASGSAGSARLPLGGGASIRSALSPRGLGTSKSS